MATYYVDPAGDNGDDGSIGSPKLTIAAGLALLTSAGDVLMINDGSYDEQLRTQFTSGSSGSPKTIRATNLATGRSGRNAIIRSTSSISTAGMVTIPTPASYITLQGIKFDGSVAQPLGSGDRVALHIGDNGAGTGPVHHIIVKDCEVTNNYYNKTGISMASDASTPPEDCTFEGNYVYNIGDSSDNQEHGIYTKGDRHIIRGNFIDNIGGSSPTASGGWGIHYYYASTQNDDGLIYGNDVNNCANGILFAGGTGNLCYNNLVRTIARDAITLFHGGGTDANNGVYCNTLYNILRHAVRIAHTDFSNTTIQSNIFRNITGSFVLDAGATNTVQSNNFTNDPLFTNVAGGDFTLQAGSGARAYALDHSSLFTTDFDGNTRSTWDAGAFEDGASVDPYPPVIGHNGTYAVTVWTLEDIALTIFDNDSNTKDLTLDGSTDGVSIEFGDTTNCTVT